MNGFMISPVAISAANGPRPAFFAGSVNDVFGLGLSSSYRMGQRTDQDWYNEAREEVLRTAGL